MLGFLEDHEICSSVKDDKVTAAWVVSIGSIIFIVFGCFIAHEWINAPEYEEIDVDQIIKDIEEKQDKDDEPPSDSTGHLSEVCARRKAA